MYLRPMSKNDRIDALVAGLAVVRDEQLRGELHTSGAALLPTILGTPVEAARRARAPRRRRRALAFAAAVAIGAVLTFPALSVVRTIAGLGSGADDLTPVPTSSEMMIASGRAGVPWKIVAVRSDHGLCWDLHVKDPGEGWSQGFGCDYLDLRGNLPPDVRGNPSRPCLTSPTEAVPCGSLPRHWVDFPGDTTNFSGYAALDRVIVTGVAAQGVAAVELVLTNGKTVPANLVEHPHGLPLSFYWAALPREDGYRRSSELVEVTKMVIARDGAGRVLERRVQAWNGNPTGDPDGPPPPS
jgi:hypothetical protein